MNIRNCKNCNKIYSYDGFKICPKCRSEENEMFERVCEYIYDNKDADIKEVSQATEVATKKILEFLRQGKLEIRPGSNLILDCERCSKPIRSGRFCDKCIVEMQGELRGAIAKEDKKEDKRYINAEKLNVKNRR